MAWCRNNCGRKASPKKRQCLKCQERREMREEDRRKWSPKPKRSEEQEFNA